MNDRVQSRVSWIQHLVFHHSHPTQSQHFYLLWNQKKKNRKIQDSFEGHCPSIHPTNKGFDSPSMSFQVIISNPFIELGQ